LKNPFKRKVPRAELMKALSADPEVVESLANRTANFTTRLGGTNQRVQAAFNRAQSANYAWMYANSPAVRTVVDLIARNISQLDLRLYEEIDEAERKPRPDHAAALSLRYPNDSMARDLFIRAIVQDFLVFNNAYATKHRNRTGDPLKFVVIPAQKVEVMGPGLVPEAYKINNLNGTSFVVGAEDMLHWRGWNPDDPRIGVSPLETLRAVIAEEAALLQAIVELAQSGMTEPTWVSRPLEASELEWSNEARTRFEEDLAARLKGATKVPPVLEEGMRLEGFGVSPREAQMLEARKYALQQVATLYGVPLGMVGLADNVEEAQAEFYSDTLPPYCEQLTRQLDLHVLQAEFDETEFYFEFDLDEKLMGDERLKALTSAAGVPPLLRNEARARLNLPPVEDGDEPITPQNVTVGGKPSPQVMPIQNPTKPSQEGDAREDEPFGQSLTRVLRRHYERQATSGKGFDLERWNRELAEDLSKAGMNGDAELAAVSVNREIAQALEEGEPAEVFNRAKADAPYRAALLGLDLMRMRELGVPEEVIWERAGFSQGEIDRMRSLRLAETLSADEPLQSRSN